MQWSQTTLGSHVDHRLEYVAMPNVMAALCVVLHRFTMLCCVLVKIFAKSPKFNVFLGSQFWAEGRGPRFLTEVYTSGTYMAKSDDDRPIYLGDCRRNKRKRKKKIEISKLRGAFKKFCNSTMKENGNVTNYILFFNIMSTASSMYLQHFSGRLLIPLK